ncbi:MAG: hypothetical protein GY862_34210 [Gammaproteobacteria bacterium]|nr:hypothetical protein [Gammaproteobacteria bacterium]
MRIRRGLAIILAVCSGYACTSQPTADSASKGNAASDEGGRMSKSAEQPLIVVKSTPTGLFAKGAFPEGERAIRLFTGQSVELIANDGTVLTLKGSASGTPVRTKSEKSELKLYTTLALLRDKPAELGELSRQANRGNRDKPPKIWMANVEKRGNYCARRNSIKLWRSNPDKVETLIMTAHAPPGKKTEIRWPAGKSEHLWPFKNGATYLAKLDSRPGGTSKLTFHQIPKKIQFKPKRVVWMARKGCVEQAQRLFPW